MNCFVGRQFSAPDDLVVAHTPSIKTVRKGAGAYLSRSFRPSAFISPGITCSRARRTVRGRNSNASRIWITFESPEYIGGHRDRSEEQGHNSE